ncbi:MAG: hypothetical protein M0D54_13035 [Hyphomonadaceae bacterium JAD_PAG50586_4]|nr:MAG: hypothetical protein M0D54_13035 [Hyphomonadaceae bacterium JAD_PAG50586_4]
MSAALIAASSLGTSLARYRRSLGLWLILLTAPIAARYMIPIGPDAMGVRIAIGSQLPEMTSPFLGVSLGIVIATLMLPVGWLYLRSNTTRRQPWQIEEVSVGSRLAIAFGRFGADAAVMLAMLAVLTLSGFFLAWLILPLHEINLAHIAFALWVVAAPALLGLAALRILFDARPLTRSGFGDFLFFVLWITSIAMPAITEGASPSFANNMYDFAGFVRPLTAGAPAGSDSFSIGGIEVEPGFVALDVFAGLFSDGYLLSRLAWAGIALALVAVAGLIYAPHRPRKRGALGGRLGALLNAGPPPRVEAYAPPAPRAFADALGLVAAEFRLIGAGRVFAVLAIAAMAMAALVNERGNAGALLLLAFAFSAHAGRSEARGLVALTKVAAFAPMARRVAFVAAGTLWALVLNAPALLRAPTLENFGVTAATGVGAQRWRLRWRR